MCHRLVKHLGVELELLGSLDPDDHDEIHLEIKPADQAMETYAVLNHGISCAHVAIQPARVRPKPRCTSILAPGCRLTRELTSFKI